MSIHRFAARRDANDAPLMKDARRLGCQVETYGPLDHWICWPGQKHWTAVEIKVPEKVDQPSAYTDNEKRFINLSKALGIRVEIWSCLEDVYESRANALEAA